MAADVVIRIEDVWKQYRFGVISHASLQRDLQSWWAHLRGREDPNACVKQGSSGQDGESFWALQGVSCDIRQGEVLGIIGRNGAGKSTLLKILSRVTSPTKGEIRIRGRVASLLEVGTGFHPDLTGRENIYLNGAILGMRKAEIRRKLDEIVAFSEIEKFIDTPVKRYSSGMHVRLAFAVAAHLDTDILVIDEVLAVGDAQFQKKCLGKMEAVSGSNGRTVLFVSHNMATVQKLCNRGMYLEYGKTCYLGSQTEAVARYLQKYSDSTVSLRDRTDRRGSGEIRVVGIEFKDTSGRDLEVAFSGQDIDIYLYHESEQRIKNLSVNVGLTIRTQLDVPVFSQTSALKQLVFKDIPVKGAFVCRINKLPLPAANYRLGFALVVHVRGEYLDGISDAADLTVVDGDYFGSGVVSPISHGVCLVDAEWRSL